jgi:ATP-dependent helicase HrpA
MVIAVEPTHSDALAATLAAIVAPVSEVSVEQVRQLRARLDGLTFRDAARLGRRLKSLRGDVSAETLQKM